MAKWKSTRNFCKQLELPQEVVLSAKGLRENQKVDNLPKHVKFEIGKYYLAKSSVTMRPWKQNQFSETERVDTQKRKVLTRLVLRKAKEDR